MGRDVFVGKTVSEEVVTGLRASVAFPDLPGTEKKHPRSPAQRPSEHNPSVMPVYRVATAPLGDGVRRSPVMGIVQCVIVVCW